MTPKRSRCQQAACTSCSSGDHSQMTAAPCRTSRTAADRRAASRAKTNRQSVLGCPVSAHHPALRLRMPARDPRHSALMMTLGGRCSGPASACSPVCVGLVSRVLEAGRSNVEQRFTRAQSPAADCCGCNRRAHPKLLPETIGLQIPYPPLAAPIQGPSRLCRNRGTDRRSREIQGTQRGRGRPPNRRSGDPS